MDKAAEKRRAEKVKQSQDLEALLLKRLESNETTLFTRATLDEIKTRVAARLKAKKSD
jgi:hypothetical protein